MKYLRIVHVFILAFLSLSFFACDRFPSDPDPEDPRDALYVLVEAHALKQLWIYHYFETFSKNYEEGQLFVYEPSEAELESLYEELNAVLQYKDNVVVAAQTLTDSLGLTPTPLSKTSGIFGSLFNFFSEGDEVGERHRGRILLIVSNMSPGERSDLFHNQLRSKWQREFLDADDFWTKLQNGDLDNRTGSIYNDFYDNSDLNNRFVSLANDRKLSPGNIFVKEGASLVEKGADVVLETSKIVTPLGKGADIVEEGKKWWEKAEKAVDTPMELVKDEIKERVAGKLAGMMDIDGVVNAVGLGEKTANGLKILADISVGTDDTQELYEKAIDWGVAKISSPDKSIAPEVIVAENKSGGSSVPDMIFGVGNYVNNLGEILMSLPAGNWNVTAVNKKGEKASAPAITVTAQQETTVNIQMTGSLHEDVKTRLERANFISIYFQYGDYTQNMGMESSRDYLLSSGGTSFGTAYDYVNDDGVHYILNISGNTTIITYDLPGINISASRSIRQPNDGSGLYKHWENEISINNLPFAYFSGSTGAYFEIDDYYNTEYRASLSAIVNFSERTITYNSEGEIISDTTVSTIQDPGQARLRVGLFNLNTP